MASLLAIFVLLVIIMGSAGWRRMVVEEKIERHDPRRVVMSPLLSPQEERVWNELLEQLRS